MTSQTPMVNANASQTALEAGFAMVVNADTEPGLAMLIAEDEEGATEPINIVTTMSEARELAQDDMRLRMAKLDRGEDPGICPYNYKVWGPAALAAPLRRRRNHRGLAWFQTRALCANIGLYSDPDHAG